MNSKQINYLALGDSYTIAESVPIWEGFPYLFVERARESGLSMNGAEVVAKTGYTTEELLA